MNLNHASSDLRPERKSGTSIQHLPDEVLVLIFSFLSVEDISRAASVCGRWGRVTEDRRVWRSKSYLSEGERALSDALPVARALPVLERVSVHRGVPSRVYLSGKLADFEVPELWDREAMSVISSLVTKDLSIDISFLEEESSNCLAVQLHQLKQLRVFDSPQSGSRVKAVAKLRALTRSLSSEHLLNLRSVDISISMLSDRGDILAALATCPNLERLQLSWQRSLSWEEVAVFSKLQFLRVRGCTLKGCEIEDLSFLDLCPNLRTLELEHCQLLRRRELSRKSELRSLVLEELPVDSECLEALCVACPQLEEITISDCDLISHLLPLRHCPQLNSVSVRRQTLECGAGLPSGLRHLTLNMCDIESTKLAEMVKPLHRLTTLGVSKWSVTSPNFLHHCTGLTELSLELYKWEAFYDYNELRRLTNLRKLRLAYDVEDGTPLVEMLCSLPWLESLDLEFMFTHRLSGLPFLHRCLRLRSLALKFHTPVDTGLLSLHELVNLKELTKLIVNNYLFSAEILEDILLSLPQLEELNINFAGTECDFSFLRHCCRLTSLYMEAYHVRVWDFTGLRCLGQLRRLVLSSFSARDLSDEQLQLLAKEVRRMPQLEYLCLGTLDCILLESWKWRKINLEI